MNARLKRIGGTALIFVGLGLTFLFIKERAPLRGEVRIVLKAGAADFDRVVLDYRSAAGGPGESLRRVQLFPRGPVSEVKDQPSLPEGEYVLVIDLEGPGGTRSFKKRYRHEGEALVTLELAP